MSIVADKTNKTLIHDIILSNILSLIPQEIPNALTSDNVYVFLPGYYYIKREIPQFKQYIIPYQEKIKGAGRKLHGNFIMNVRVSMLRDIERLKLQSKVLDDCCLVYSMWAGYKEEYIYKTFLDKMRELEIDVFDLHTSGHADYECIKQVISILKPKAIIPIHTENKERIKDYTDKAVILSDMEVYEV